jgi:hypothetical protein
LYKIDKNNWEDAVIRTQASSDSVKAIDAVKQVKEPLSLKYKEWQGTYDVFNLHIPKYQQTCNLTISIYKHCICIINHSFETN